MIRLITFTSGNMDIAANICAVSGMRNNANNATVYRPCHIDSKFYHANEHILKQERGAGYWLWKPYFINQALSRMNEGEYLVYADAGVEFVNNIKYITDAMDQDVFLFGNQYQHLHWCKADVYNAIDNSIQFNKQCQASVIVVKNTFKSRSFIDDWLNWCQIKGMIDDSPSSTPNHPEFREHRHDQAVLTCLAYHNRIKLHWWPAIYNAGAFGYDHTGYSDKYPVIFHHHRMRDVQFASTDPLDVAIKNYLRKKY